MANEAKVITLLGNKGDVIEYTVALGSPIPKGTLMYLDSSPMTVKATDNTGSQIFAGVASEEFVSGTAYTTAGSHNKLPCWTHAVMEMETSDQNQVLVGRTVCTSSKGPNFIGSLGGDIIEESAMVVGKALSTAVTSTAIPVLMNVGKTY